MLFLRAVRCLLLPGLLAVSAHAGDSPPEPQGLETFLKNFLREQPRFRATGLFTLKKAGKPAVVCEARIHFDKAVGAVFAYNTDARDLEPWDFYYWKRHLALFVYDRPRQTVLKSELQGAPLRPVFNFVWDVIEEGEKGRGLKSFIFSGLMRTRFEETSEAITVSFRKNLLPLPVRDLIFTFDPAYRLQSIKLTESDGSTHSFQVLQFQKTTEKLRKPKIRKRL